MKSLTAFLLAAFCGLFVTLFLMMYAGAQAAQYDTTANLTNTFDPSIINETISSGGAMYNDFQNSGSDQSSQISLFKNAPGTIKTETRLGFHVFSRLFAAGAANYVPMWALSLVFVMFLLIIVAILIRMATGQTI